MAQSLHSSDASRVAICNLQQAFPIRDDEIHVVDLLPGPGLDVITLDYRIMTLNSGCSFEALLRLGRVAIPTHRQDLWLQH
jgi:hypothetical protein